MHYRLQILAGLTHMLPGLEHQSLDFSLRQQTVAVPERHRIIPAHAVQVQA
ncbi:hypothetical protein IQ693_004673, partial [Salmonella enterica]|nr:hypothetical protein [Salmonella enterica]EKD9372152.1 hypothetical protein [Salmonella enterica]EKG6626125.1 hypothetical protein [Salmonella enterica]EKK8218436.1 hypothetical protein [Salmonella enterica]EKK8505436.1 hypothetical protein [Salmonella enterica]